MIQRERVVRYALETLSAVVDCPFEQDDDSQVLRHPVSRKWFGIIMTISRRQLGLLEDTPVTILNLKEDPLLIDSLVKQQGFFRAWHMNKLHWITAVLDDTLPDEAILPLMDMAFDLTAPKKRSRA